jgi:DNA-binding transcriptional LysR family regulator
MSLELRQLRYFIAVAEEMHFGRAAKKLHMTQPPLSQAIIALEAQLGTPLFLRSTRQTELTHAGTILLPEARKLVAQAALLPQLAQRAALGELGQIRLAFISVADYSILPNVLRNFRHAHPQVSFDLLESTTDKQWQLLENREIDAGILVPPLPRGLSKHLHYCAIHHENLVLALPTQHAQRSNAGQLKTYRDLPLIIFPRKIAPALHDAILTCFHQQGITPVIAQEAIQMQTIIALVSANLGMALVPQSLAQLQRPGVHYQELEHPSAQLEVGVAWHVENHSPALTSFIQALKNHKEYSC